MAKSWIEEIGLNELGEKLGRGAMIGGAIAGAVSLIAWLGGMTGGLGWLSWLIVPAVTMAGAIAGDAVTKDGAFFGKEGVIPALGNHFKPKTIPEGYIAANPYATTYAADSAVLERTGQAHMTGIKSFSLDEIALGYHEARPLDPYVEVGLAGDPRLKELKSKAREYQKLYADPGQPESYIADVRERERKITLAIVEDIGKIYGPYSMETMNDPSKNSGEYEAIHHPKRWLLGSKTMEMKDVKKGELVCRHYALVAGQALNAAGIRNRVVCSNVGVVSCEGGRFRFDYSHPAFDKDVPVMGHAYVITGEGNAVVEATVAGNKEKQHWAYRPILNGVTVEDIVYKGSTALVEMPEGKRGFAYGGHNGQGGKERYDWFAPSEKTLSADAMKGMQQTMEAYNAAGGKQEEVKEKAPVLPVQTYLEAFQTFTAFVSNPQAATLALLQKQGGLSGRKSKPEQAPAPK